MDQSTLGLLGGRAVSPTPIREIREVNVFKTEHGGSSSKMGSERD